MKRKEEIKVGKVAMYARVGNPEQFENDSLSRLQENEKKEFLKKLENKNFIRKMDKQMSILSNLEELSYNKLSILEKKTKKPDIKAIIYMHGDDTEKNIKDKLYRLRNFCKSHKINVVKEIINESSEKNYHNEDFKNLIYSIYTKEINAIVLDNIYDIGDNSLINTYVINEIITKNNVRLISLRQRIDTNSDYTLINYENPVFVKIMDFMELEEKRIRSEKIKIGKALKKRMKEEK